MKTLLLAIALTLTLFSGCVSQDTTKLRIGMTKEEVIQVMGKPGTTGADDSFEYLNYWVSGGAGVRQFYTVRLANGLVAAYGVGSVAPARTVSYSPTQSVVATAPSSVKTTKLTGEATENSIRILSIQPDAAVPERPTVFKIKISYAYAAPNEGLIVISFNTISPKAFLAATSKKIDHGSGELEVSVSVTPKDWAQPNRFLAKATLFAGTNLGTSGHLSLSEKEILLVK